MERGGETRCGSEWEMCKEVLAENAPYVPLVDAIGAPAGNCSTTVGSVTPADILGGQGMCTERAPRGK